MSEADLDLVAAANSLAESLRTCDVRVVFAESCTAGLAAATLARTPGISEWHCGSFVVYRIDSKARWLGVSRDLLSDPGPVSEVVARAMARGALERTPEATLAVSITGHLGPGAPAAQDGLCYVGWATRGGEGEEGAREVRLQATDRVVRQAEAATELLSAARRVAENRR